MPAQNALRQIQIGLHVGDRGRRRDSRIVTDQFARYGEPDHERSNNDQRQKRKNRPALAGGTVGFSGTDIGNRLQIVISSFSLSAAILSRLAM